MTSTPIPTDDSPAPAPAPPPSPPPLPLLAGRRIGDVGELDVFLEQHSGDLSTWFIAVGEQGEPWLVFCDVEGDWAALRPLHEDDVVGERDLRAGRQRIPAGRLRRLDWITPFTIVYVPGAPVADESAPCRCECHGGAS